MRLHLPFRNFTIHDLNTGRATASRDLAEMVGQRSDILASHIQPERRNFVIAHGNSIDFFADLFAVWKIGGCAVCVNPGLTGPEMANIVDFCDPAAILVADVPSDNNGPPILCTWNTPAPSMPGSGLSSDLDQPALILFTSGTTGAPKGVTHSHRSLLARVSLNIAHLGAETLVRSLCVLPTHFGHGLIGNCLTPLAVGADLFLMPNPGIQGAARLGTVLDQNRISFLSSVPSFWKMALRLSPPPKAGTLRRVNIGSAPLSSEIWQGVIDWAKGAEVANMYGITETANWIGGASSQEFDVRDGLLGRLWGGEAAIKSAGGEILGHGRGEILLRVPSLMTGYYQRPDLTEAVISNGWYHTGDSGELSPDGVLRLTGRRANIIINAGINIFPEELDLLFERHPDVTEACAFGRDDEVSGQSVALAVSLMPNSVIDSGDLINWVRERLRPEAIPREIFILKEIPKTDRGKLNRKLVADACLGNGA